MHVSMLDNALWAGSFAGNLALFIVLLIRARWRQFPVFTVLIGFYVAKTICLFILYKQNEIVLYKWVYWTAAFVDLFLQVALIFEMARIVLRPTGTWVQDAKVRFLGFGAAGAIVAFALSYAVHPYTGATFSDWVTRINLFTSLLFCELFLAMVLTSHMLGLQWRNHVMNLGHGLTAWALISTLVDTAHSYFPANSYFGMQHHFTALEQIRVCSYLAALSYWVITFWLQEPERKPISEEMQKYIVALHAKVQYDSNQVSSVHNLR